MPTQALLDCRLVYRKNETHPLHPELDRLSASVGKAEYALFACKNGKQSVQIDRKTDPTVENRLHIHRTGCAKNPF
jgi:hypothetical protein